MPSIDTTISHGDMDIDICVEYKITYWGSPGCGPSLTYPGDPPEAPEFEIESISFEHEGVTGELEWDSLSEIAQDCINECIYEQIAEGPDDYYD